MVYDYSMLSGKITEVFGTQGNFAKAIGLSERSVSLKLNNRVPWSQPEITKASKLLGISNEKISLYFFLSSADTDTTLKTCPFCGGIAETVYAAFDCNFYGVMCTNCEAYVSAPNSEERAKEKWNRRCFNEASDTKRRQDNMHDYGAI